jgi:DNA repair/transcription protein MET18/MMS19
MSEFATLLPLLLQSLDLQQETVKTATLETVAVIIARNPSALEESGHVPALVRRLLNAATISKTVPRKGRGDESMHSEKPETSKTGHPPPLATDMPTVRRLAVRCLFLMPGHISEGSGSRPNPLLTLKRDVLQGLLKVLDDPKRDVRKEAVDARAAWIRGVDDIQEEDSD